MNVPTTIISDLKSKGCIIKSSTYVSGGDINEAIKIVTEDDRIYFLKFNTSAEASGLLTSELEGLKLLDQHKLSVPNIVASYTTDTLAFLLMDWIQTSLRNDDKLAEELVTLHQITNSQYGLGSDNYIGSLPQKNTWCSSFSEFYVTCRIEPQLKMARENGFNFKVSLESFQTLIDNEIPKEPPTLIHGDLWSGNLMDSIDGPVLIDPSVSFCHREMDLAMMQLFGGFSTHFYNAYDERLPLIKGWQGRADLFQLYYLLVHLNIFGSSYRGQVERVLEKYLR